MLDIYPLQLMTFASLILLTIVVRQIYNLLQNFIKWIMVNLIDKSYLEGHAKGELRSKQCIFLVYFAKMSLHLIFYDLVHSIVLVMVIHFTIVQ